MKIILRTFICLIFYLSFKAPCGAAGIIDVGGAQCWEYCNGTLRWPDGQTYVGETRRGLLDGQGTYYWPDGQRYVGEFRNGNRSGQGTYYWPNGQRYIGDYLQGQQHGYGTLYASDNSIIQSGEWESGRFVGLASNNSQGAPSNIPRTANNGVGALGGAIFGVLAVIVGSVYQWVRSALASLRANGCKASNENANASKQKAGDANNRERQEHQSQQESFGRRFDGLSNRMSVEQALAILGLKAGANETDIRAAYRRLMKLVHPDVGGSAYFSQQLNEARDVLLGSFRACA